METLRRKRLRRRGRYTTFGSSEEAFSSSESSIVDGRADGYPDIHFIDKRSTDIHVNYIITHQQKSQEKHFIDWVHTFKEGLEGLYVVWENVLQDYFINEKISFELFCSMVYFHTRKTYNLQKSSKNDHESLLNEFQKYRSRFYHREIFVPDDNESYETEEYDSDEYSETDESFIESDQREYDIDFDNFCDRVCWELETFCRRNVYDFLNTNFTKESIYHLCEVPSV